MLWSHQHRGSHKPSFFNPLQTRLPLPALVSIAHRLSGLALAFLAPLALVILSYSLEGPSQFNFVKSRLHVCPYFKAFVFVTASIWAFHALGGIRHFLMDLELYHSLKGARVSALLTLGLASAIIIFIALVVLWV